MPQHRHRDDHQRFSGGATGNTPAPAEGKKAQDPLDWFGVSQDPGCAIPLGTARTKAMFLAIPRKRRRKSSTCVVQYHRDGTTGDLRINRDGSNGYVGKKTI